jgi:hypothetical protein
MLRSNGTWSLPSQVTISNKSRASCKRSIFIAVYLGLFTTKVCLMAFVRVLWGPNLALEGVVDIYDVVMSLKSRLPSELGPALNS